MTTKWFSKSNLTLNLLKKEYRILLKKYHPDLGGSEEATKSIINEYNKLIKYVINTGFEFYQQEREKNNQSRYEADLTPFYDILKKVMSFSDKYMRIEVIGYWIYCFKSFQSKDKLKALGFWYSKKHKAWIYNGRNCKSFLRTRLSLSQIKRIHGVKIINPDKKNKKLLILTKRI